MLTTAKGRTKSCRVPRIYNFASSHIQAIRLMTVLVRHAMPPAAAWGSALDRPLAAPCPPRIGRECCLRRARAHGRGIRPRIPLLGGTYGGLSALQAARDRFDCPPRMRLNASDLAPSCVGARRDGRTGQTLQRPDSSRAADSQRLCALVHHGLPCGDNSATEAASSAVGGRTSRDERPIATWNNCTRALPAKSSGACPPRIERRIEDAARRIEPWGHTP